MLNVWTFDPPSGTAICTDADALRLEAATPGLEVVGWYGFNYTGRVEDIQHDFLFTQVLACQLRWLYRTLPAINPQLRASIPMNMGRQRMVAWYDALYEKMLPYQGLIDPTIVVFTTTGGGTGGAAGPCGSPGPMGCPAGPPGPMGTPGEAEAWKPCPMEYRSGKHTCCPACDGKGKVLA